MILYYLIETLLTHLINYVDEMKYTRLFSFLIPHSCNIWLNYLN